MWALRGWFSKMKVLSPVDKVDEVEELIEAGADELYCGVLSQEWWQRYTIAAINRRIAKVCNFKSFDELRACLEVAHSYHIPVCLTINEHYYTQEQYPLLLEYVAKAIDAGVDSFLISDLALLLYLREMKVGIPIHVSIGGTTFNSETAKFYQSLGASRVTLPRHITIGEAREIVTNVSNVETCVFILNSRCPNVDGFCTFIHVQSPDPSYKNACMLPYSVKLLPSAGAEEQLCADGEEPPIAASGMRQQVWARHHMDEIPCGACALYDFDEMGVDYVKIVGRGNQTRRKVTDIKFIRLLLRLVEDRSISRQEYRKRARALYSHTYQRPCRTIMCYYPEVMLPERTRV